MSYEDQVRAVLGFGLGVMVLLLGTLSLLRWAYERGRITGFNEAIRLYEHHILPGDRLAPKEGKP